MDMDIHNFNHQLGGEDIRCQKSLVLAHHTTNQEVWIQTQMRIKFYSKE